MYICNVWLQAAPGCLEYRMSIWLQKSFLKFYQVLSPQSSTISSVVSQAFGALELKGPLYMTSYRMFTCRPISFQYFHASNFTSNSSMDSVLIIRSSLYNSNYGQSVLNSVNRASYITIKSSGIRTEPWWTSTPKLLTATIVNFCPACHVLDHAMQQLHQLLVDLKPYTLPTCSHSLC